MSQETVLETEMVTPKLFQLRTSKSPWYVSGFIGFNRIVFLESTVYWDQRETVGTGFTRNAIWAITLKFRCYNLRRALKIKRKVLERDKKTMLHEY